MIHYLKISKNKYPASDIFDYGKVENFTGKGISSVLAKHSPGFNKFLRSIGVSSFKDAPQDLKEALKINYSKGYIPTLHAASGYSPQDILRARSKDELAVIARSVGVDPTDLKFLTLDKARERVRGAYSRFIGSNIPSNIGSTVNYNTQSSPIPPPAPIVTPRRGSAVNAIEVGRQKGNFIGALDNINAGVADRQRVARQAFAFRRQIQELYGVRLDQADELAVAAQQTGIPLSALPIGRAKNSFNYDEFAPKTNSSAPLLGFRQFLRNAKISTQGSVFGDNSEISRGRASKAFGLAIASSFVGGAVASQITNPQGQRAAEGIGSGVGIGATIASIAPGGVGIAIGAVVGGFIALKKIIDNLRPSLADLNDKFAKLRSDREKEIQGASQALQAGDELGTSGNLSKGQRRALLNQFSTGITEIPSNLQQKFIKGSKDDREEILNSLNEKGGGKTSVEEGIKLITAESQKRGFGKNVRDFVLASTPYNPFATIARNASQVFGRGDVESPFNFDGENQSRFSQNIVGGISSDLVNTLTPGEFGKRINTGTNQFNSAPNTLKGKSDAVNQFLNGQLGFDEKQVATFISGVTDPAIGEQSKIKALEEAIRAFGDSAVVSFRNLKDATEQAKKKAEEATIVYKSLFERFQSASKLKSSILESGLIRGFQSSSFESSGRFGLQSGDIQNSGLKQLLGSSFDNSESDFKLGKNRIDFENLLAKRKINEEAQKGNDQNRLGISSLGETLDVTSFSKQGFKNQLIQAAKEAAKGNLNPLQSLRGDLESLAKGSGSESTASRDLLGKIGGLERDKNEIARNLLLNSKLQTQEYQQQLNLLNQQYQVNKKLELTGFFGKFNPNKPFDNKDIVSGNNSSVSNIIRRGLPEFSRGLRKD
jgi:hypothetical protein